LLCFARWLDRTVEELAAKCFAPQPALPYKLAQRILRAHVQPVIELLDKIARFGGLHHRRRRRKQGTVRGEPDFAERPQTTLIKVYEFIEGVVGPSMGVAGAVR
jgi:hypothetical protein